MNLNKIIYDIRESLSLRTDDSEIDNRYITHLINIKRAKFLRQELNNYQRTTDITVTQTFCLGLERVSLEECPIDATCEFIYRTKKPIPKPIELHTKSSITSVKPVTRNAIPFNFIIKQMAPFISGAIFKNRIYCFLDNDMYIYFLSDNDALGMIDCVTITGIFEDPTELISYKKCCGCNDENSICFDVEKTEYPLQPHYIDLVKNEIIKDLVYFDKFKEDEINNSDDDKE